MKLTNAQRALIGWIAGDEFYRRDERPSNNDLKKAYLSLLEKGLIRISDRNSDKFEILFTSKLPRYHWVHTSRNQDILRDLVNREVYACQSSLVDQLLSIGFFEYDSITNNYIYNVDLHNGSEEFTEDQINEKIQEIEEQIEELEDQMDDLSGAAYNSVEAKRDRLQEDLDACNDKLSDPDLNEAYEWWLCSTWWLEKAEEAGHPILETDYETWWGRPTTGQSISMDGLTVEIALDMKILIGMENCWEKNRTVEEFCELIGSKPEELEK